MNIHDNDDDFPRTHAGHGGRGRGFGGPGGFGGFGSWDGNGGFDPFGISDVMRKMAGGGRGHGRRMSRGDVRQAVLALLAEEPMHGYQIIRELEERSGGTWKPSAGSVYPTLQMLTDEGLLEAAEDAGKKVYSLTEAGRSAAAEEADEPKPWEQAAGRGFGSGFTMELGKELAKLGQATSQIMRGGTKEQAEAAATVLADARKGIYRILAED
ncbi:PadR family transcriptional regulator [Brevibacterium sp. 50QC2O2]|nr:MULTISPECIES: PadR family transcriptional regulator [unclassified Brevibacterium]MCQ9367921.1 PadR family transcriptional regulator [Brevibacterium sp. 91QC2O2]MCQ9386373.1 PadR family transcriptional regulator [Brevibacterium sp. 68QC2CO]MCQ9387114.1 PadR family transcriptional regulator [Brevibacterium sp. 50QC2O2]